MQIDGEEIIHLVEARCDVVASATMSEQIRLNTNGKYISCGWARNEGGSSNHFSNT